jgi:gluconolactonase
MSVAVLPTAGAFVTHDARFADVLGPAPHLEPLARTDAHEGPVYVADEDAVYFTTVPRPGTVPGFPRVDIMRLVLGDGEPTIVRADAAMANGMTADGRGGLLVCQQGTRTRPAAIVALDLGARTVRTVVDRWMGLRLNSPNDVVVARDGAIWFTDPSYGHLQGFRPPPHTGDHVYRYDPATGRLTVVADTLDKPNGLAFSPDGSVLYVGDSGAPNHVKAYDVVRGDRLAGERVFAAIAPGSPDGLKADAAGRVYCSCATGVQVFDPSGARLGEITLPGAVNFTFGGRDGDVLLITADDAIWAAHLAATGL